MLGLMQSQPLSISMLLRNAARHHAATEIVSKSVEGDIYRTSWGETERHARRLVHVLISLGVKANDRVGTLAWNSHRHLEVYYAAPGMEAICHTINPRLHPDDVAYIINHAGDGVLFVENSFTGLIDTIALKIAGTVRAVVMMTDAADEDYVWPVFDENTASALCYTSGTTGRPKGVLYSHRSTLLHAYAANIADALGLRAVDRILPVVPMFHVNAWGTPYAAAMAGASLIMPGRHLDGPSLETLMNQERVTVAAGVPTVWMGLLQHLRASGRRLETVKRIITGGSACPPLLIEAFGLEYGVPVEHAWGMSEISPIGTFNKPKQVHAGLDAAGQLQLALKQGRILPGLDM